MKRGKEEKEMGGKGRNLKMRAKNENIRVEILLIEFVKVAIFVGIIIIKSSLRIQ